MVDLLVLFPELMATMISLASKPFRLPLLVFVVCLKTTFIVIHTCFELMKASMRVHLNVFRNIIIWIIALLSLPVRVLTALQRERLLEEHLHKMQIELENLVCDRKELEDQLQIAIKEHRILESMLAEVEDENDKAVAKIEFLECELQNQKLENIQLKEMQHMQFWSFKGHGDTDSSQNTNIADDYGNSNGVKSCKSGYKESGIIFQDLMMHKDTTEAERKSKPQPLNFLKTGASRASGHTDQPFAPVILSRNLDINEWLEERKVVAIWQSLFGAVLSVLVGMIIWKAKNPCMPLVAALFTVVGISLKSVVEFFLTLKNKPACEAVTLLSFNWFLLGTIAHPMLPRVACMLTPLLSSFLDQTTGWLRISSHEST